MKDPHTIIIAPLITEKAVRLSYGDPREKDETKLIRKYTFLVNRDANKIEIKSALEAIYNVGKKKPDHISITSVRTIRIVGKQRRRGKSVGHEPDRKKAVITLGVGQIIEDYGV